MFRLLSLLANFGSRPLWWPCWTFLGLPGVPGHCPALPSLSPLFIVRLAAWSVSSPRLPPYVPYTGMSPNKILVYLILSWIIWTNTSLNLFPHLQNSVNSICWLEVIRMNECDNTCKALNSGKYRCSINVTFFPLFHFFLSLKMLLRMGLNHIYPCISELWHLKTNEVLV